MLLIVHPLFLTYVIPASSLFTQLPLAHFAFCIHPKLRLQREKVIQ